MAAQLCSQDIPTIAIVGGGRWARVYIKVLRSLNLPYQLIVVSRSNRAEICEAFHENKGALIIVPSLDELLKYQPIAMAIIVNSARQHFDSAMKLIYAGVPVLIEKPLALEQNQVNLLYGKAKKMNVCVTPALTFLRCSYLNNFSQQLAENKEAPVKIQIEWHDPYGEVRYGESKHYDPTISVAQDVMPHIWSILYAAVGRDNKSLQLNSCSIKRGGQFVQFDSTFEEIPCSILLERNSSVRRRFLSIEFIDAPKLELDFTIEPGVFKSKAFAVSADKFWLTDTIKPIQQQIEAFLAQAKGMTGGVDIEFLAIASATAAEKSDCLLKEAQKTWLSTLPTSHMSEDIIYALSELTASELYKMNIERIKDKNIFKEHLYKFIQYVNGQKHASVNWHLAFKNSLDNYLFSN